MADPALQAIRDAWDKEKGGRDEDEPRRLSDEYVSAHPELFEKLQGMTQKQCVQAIDVLRDQPDNQFGSLLRSTVFGDADVEEPWFLVQVWLWHEFEPQNIGGTYEGELRVNHGR